MAVALLFTMGGLSGIAKAGAAPSNPPSMGPDRLPGGGGGGNCPTPYVIDLGSAYVTNSTNATVMFWGLPTSPEPTGMGTVYWGPTPSYGATIPAIGFTMKGAGTAADFINFLGPNTTYYYEISGTQTCTDSNGTHMYSGTTTGNFFTGADDMHYITGTVYDVNSQKAASGFAVQVTCVNDGPRNGYFDSYSYTSSAGQFSVPIISTAQMPAPYYDCQDSGDGGFYIQAENGPYGGYLGGITWPGHWNETIETMAPQLVNFYLPLDFVGANFSIALDFSNAPAQYGSLTWISGSTLTTTLTNVWSVSGQFGVAGGGGSGSSSMGVQAGSNSGWWSNSGTLDIIARWWITGVLLCNTIVRGCGITWENDIGLPYSDGFASQDPTFVAPSDWLTPSTYAAHGGYYLLDGAGLAMKNKFTPAYQGDNGAVTTSTTTSSSGGYSWSLGVSVSIPGFYIPLAGLTASLGWSQTSSYTVSNTLSWSIGGPTQSCYDVFGQGGSAPPPPGITTADMIGIYYLAPPVNGVCSGG